MRKTTVTCDVCGNSMAETEPCFVVWKGENIVRPIGQAVAEWATRFCVQYAATRRLVLVGKAPNSPPTSMPDSIDLCVSCLLDGLVTGQQKKETPDA